MLLVDAINSRFSGTIDGSNTSLCSDQGEISQAVAGLRESWIESKSGGGVTTDKPDSVSRGLLGAATLAP